MSGAPTFKPRLPSTEPELLRMELHEGGIVVATTTMYCSYAHCDEPAIYEAHYSDTSWSYYCREHGIEEARAEELSQA